MSHPPTTPDATPHQQFHRFISRADALTLLGMVILISSLFLVWKQTTLPIAPGAAIAYISSNVRLVERGYSLPDWSLMVFCAVACNICLLCTITPRNRYPLSLIHGVFGVGGFLLILRYLSPQIGAIVGAGAGALLAWGAVERFQESKILVPNSNTGKGE